MSHTKEKKIASINEMAQKLTKTLVDEEETLCKQIKYFKENQSQVVQIVPQDKMKYHNMKTTKNKTSIQPYQEAMSAQKIIVPQDKMKYHNMKTTKNKTSIQPYQEAMSAQKIITKMNKIFNDPVLRKYSPIKTKKCIPEQSKNIKGNFIEVRNKKMLKTINKISNLPNLNLKLDVEHIKYTTSSVKDDAPQLIGPHMSSTEANLCFKEGNFKFYSDMKIRAAIVIQSHFRGYQVRKVTSPLFKYKILRSKIEQPIPCEPLYEPKINSLNLLDSNGKGIRKENYKNILIPKEISQKKSSSKLKVKELTVSEHVNHFKLVETRDIALFTKRCRKSNEFIDYSWKNSRNSASKLEKEHSFTPQSGNRFRNEYNKRFPHNSSNANEEIDMKTFCSDILPIHSTTSMEPTVYNKNISPRPISDAISKSDEPSPNISGEEGFKENHNSEIPKDIHKLKSQDGIMFPVVNKSSDNIPAKDYFIENDKSILKKTSGFNMNYLSPSHLSSKVSAELLFQDTIGSALNHIQNLENIQSLSQKQCFSDDSNARNKKTFYTDILKGKTQHNFALKEDISNFHSKFEKLEKDMQESISKLEHQTRVKVKHVIESLTKLPNFEKKCTTTQLHGNEIKSLNSIYCNPAPSISFYEDAKRHINNNPCNKVNETKSIPKKGIYNSSCHEEICETSKPIKNPNFSSVDIQINIPLKNPTCENLDENLKQCSENMNCKTISKNAEECKLMSNSISKYTIEPENKPTSSCSSSCEIKANQHFRIANILSKEEGNSLHKDMKMTEDNLGTKTNEEPSIITLPHYESNDSSNYNREMLNFHINPEIKLQLENENIASQKLTNSIYHKKDPLLSCSTLNINWDISKSSKGEALQSILNLLKSVQKEEEIRLRHQIALFKLQEKFLIEEAKLKLSSIQSDGGLNVRKRQRGVLLQLREQRSYIHKFIENQNLNTKQRCLFFSQQYNLLSSTANVSNISLLTSSDNSNTTINDLTSSDGTENVCSSSSSSLLRCFGDNFSEPLLPEETGIPYRNFQKLNSQNVKQTNSLSKKVHTSNKKSSENENEMEKNRKSKEYKSTLPFNFEKKLSFIYRSNCNMDNSENYLKRKLNLIKAEASLLNSDAVDKYYSSSEDTTYIPFDKPMIICDSNQENSSSKPRFSEQSFIPFSLAGSEISHVSLHFPSPPKKQKIDSTIIMHIANRNLNEKKDAKIKTVLLPKLPSPLSPRSQLSQCRRQSSESDESVSLSQNGTFSDTSDVEGRLVALREELALRKKEAEKLKKEKRRMLRERLHSQELALKNQIASYEDYIKRKKIELQEENSKHSIQVTVKPFIRKPLMTECKLSQLPSYNTLSEVFNNNDPHTDDTLVVDDTRDVYSSNKKIKSSEKDIKGFESSAENKNISIDRMINKANLNSKENISHSFEEATEFKFLNNSKLAGRNENENAYSFNSTLDILEILGKKKEDILLIEKTDISSSGTEEIENHIEEKIKTYKNEIEDSLDSKKMETKAISVDVDKINNIMLNTIETDTKMQVQKLSTKLTEWMLDNLLNDSISCIQTAIQNKERFKDIEVNSNMAKHIALIDSIFHNINLYSDAFSKENNKIELDFSLSLNKNSFKTENAFDFENIVSPLYKESDKGASVVKKENFIKKTEQEDISLENLSTPRVLCVQNITTEFDSEAGVDTAFFVSSCEGKWMESEFWKVKDKINNQEELKEEEELLNAEIARLEELQQFKKRYPNLVIREVPDKPPPPYTPPKEEFRVAKVNENVSKLPDPQTPSNTISVPHRLSKADLRTIASSIINIFPSKEKLILSLEGYTQNIYSEWQKGTNPEFIEWELFASVRNTSIPEDDIDYTSGQNETTFMHLIFDLTRQLLAEVYHMINAPPAPIWSFTKLQYSVKPFKKSSQLTEKSLSNYVIQKALLIFGMETQTKTESSIMKWALKKKENVDQILVRDLQQEEFNWIEYSDEEAEVKTHLSRDILSTLIDDTLNIFQVILKKFKSPS